MNICFVRHGYFPACQRLRKESTALAEIGFGIDVLCLRKPGEKLYERFGNMRVFRIPLDHKRQSVIRYLFEYLASFLLFNIYLFALFCINRYPVIQVNTMPDFLVFSTFIPKLFGSKIIMDIHEPTPELWETKYGENKSGFYHVQKAVHKRAISYADHCISVTETHARYLQKSYGVRPEKFTVIENVCDSLFENFARKYKPSGTMDSGFRLIMHGAIEKRYGHEIAIRACGFLKSEIPDLKLIITGNGSHEPYLKEMVNNMGLENTVIFLGFVPKKTLLECIMEADAGLVAMEKSPYSELIETNKMYDYMAMRKPVIISRMDHLLQKFGDSCFQFFSPGDFQDLARCIKELYYDKKRREELSNQAYSKYNILKWDKMKANYVGMIKELIKISFRDSRWNENKRFRKPQKFKYNHPI